MKGHTAMVETEKIEVQQGVWIDREWIKHAGLSGPLRILIRPGEIRIVAEPGMREIREGVTGWDVFRSLGDDAPQGRLHDAATKHDSYLYKEEQ
jgi:hypothetical protein